MPNFWSDLLQFVLYAVVTALVGSVISFFFAQTKLAWARYKERQPDLAYELEQAAALAVKAAEQVYNAMKKAGLVDEIIDKKKYALEVAEKWLELKGIHVDLHALDAAIEAAVYEQFNQDKDTPKAMLGFTPGRPVDI